MCSWRRHFRSGRSAGATFAGACLLLLAGCGEHVQSVLDPQSPEAAGIARLWWFLFAVCTAVFVVVIALLFRAISTRDGGGDSRPPGGRMGFVVIGGIVVPSILLVGILVYSLGVSVSLRPPDDGLLVEVIGHQWWWEVRYPEEGIVTANEIHIPTGTKVRVTLRAADVVHSFWVPNLHGKMDALPDHPNLFWLQADRPGAWRGQCAEFCGLQHALMAFWVVALEPEDFERWLAARRAPRPEPQPEVAAVLDQGREAFERHGCAACHSLLGVEAEAEVGPDLTHVGSRLTLGAGTLPNTPGNLAGWIANPQAIKPGNRMPPTYLDPADLHALVAYLTSLR